MTTRAHISLASLSLVFLACGGNVIVDDHSSGVTTGSSGSTGAIGSSGSTGATGSGGSAGATGSSSSAGVGGGGTGGAGESDFCTAPGPATVPAMYRTCTADADCAATAVTFCCTVFSPGIAIVELRDFDAYVDTCGFHSINSPLRCDDCPTTTDTSDEDSADPNDVLTLACKDGRCTSSYVR